MTQTGNNTSSSSTPSSEYSTIGRRILDTEIETHRREFSTLYAEVAGRIGHLVLNRPASLNAINDAMLADLTEAVRWVDSRRELRVVIFKGNGRGFCAGADLNSLPFAEGRPATGNSWLYRREVGQIGTRLIEAIEQMHAVTIAQVHGCAVGGGVLFMIACDLRIVAQGTPEQVARNKKSYTGEALLHFFSGNGRVPASDLVSSA